MRDLVVFLLFVLVLPISFVRPWVGLCAFTFLAYNRTQDLLWGFAKTIPISQFIAIAMILGWILVEFRPIPFRIKRVTAIAGLAVLVSISMLMNRLRWEATSDNYTDFVKVIFVALLTGAYLTNRERLRQVLALMALALGFYGAKNGVLYWLGSKSITGPGGMLKDNNDFSLAMVMNVPLLWYLAKDMRSLRFGQYPVGHVVAPLMQVATFLTLFTIMSTGSRGAFLSLSVAAVLMAWKTKWKLPAIAGLVLAGILGVAFAPQEYKDRIASIFSKVEEQDASVQGRLVSWKVAGNMITSNPVWGIGFNNMVFDYQRYAHGLDSPEGGELRARVAHNSYLQIWAESGTLGYLCFMFILVGTIVSMERAGRRFKREGVLWAVPYCHAIQVSTCAYFVGATFLNRAHFDFVYQLAVIGACLPLVVAAEQRTHAPRRVGPRVAQHVEVQHRDPFARVGAP